MIYQFPQKDCKIIEIMNLSAEELARYILGQTEEKITMEKLQLHSNIFY